MNPDSITQRLHNRSDCELRKKLEQSIDWVWKETGHSSKTMEPQDLVELNERIGGGSDKLPKVPWIGESRALFIEVAYQYLRDKYRQKAVSDFMAKVENIGDELQELRDSIPQ